MMIEQAASSTPITPPPVSAGPMLALGLALAGLLLGAGIALAVVAYRAVRPELTAAAESQNEALPRLASTPLS